MFKKFFVHPLAPVHYNPSLTFYQPLKNNSRNYAQTKMKSFLCVKFVIAPVKGFWLVREMQECTAVIENLYLSFAVIAREHVATQSTQGTLTREHARHEHVITWTHKHVRHIGTWAREHARHVGKLARKARWHMST